MQYLSIDDAYTIQRRYTEISEDIKGWKLGGSNHTTCQLFGVSEPYFGFLIENQIYRGSSNYPRVQLEHFEVEFCVEVPADFSQSKKYDATEIVKWKAFIGLEYPNAGISDMVNKGVSHLIADNCAAGSLLVSDTGLDLRKQQSVVVNVTGQSQPTRIELTGAVENIVEAFLQISQQRGFSVRPGQIIATGGITELITLKCGSKITVSDNNGILMELEAQ